MKLSPTPDLGPWRRMLLAAFGAAVVVWLVLAWREGGDLPIGLGDTDDAMRIVMMRALAAGQGWFDQRIGRLQPPVGVFMHWSRLIDGGLAALYHLFRLGLPPAQAELATRFTWPLLWAPPVIWAALAVARRLGTGAAVLACAIIAGINVTLFLQFHPGRVDHHNVQITLCMLSFAGAALSSRRGALLAGAATGLGLAIGLEALAFEVIIGAFFALRFLCGDDRDGRMLGGYALALGLATAGFFALQTPPGRWSLVACDAIALNLVAAVALTAAGLLVVIPLTRAHGWRARLIGLGVVGAAAAALYIGLDANCLNGPFADVDDALKEFWLPNVQEIRPIPRIWLHDHETVYTLLAPALIGTIAWGALACFRAKRADPVFWLGGALLLTGSVAGWEAIRMATYANWFALPLIAAAVVALVDRWFGGLLLATVIGACLATPLFTGGVASNIDKTVTAALKKPAPKPKPKPAPAAVAPRKTAAKAPSGLRGDRCFRVAAYADLARQPAGLVLSEVDLGPFILAHTSSSAMAAPYHRMSWGLVQARGVLSTPAEKALDGARRLGVAYVLECPPHGRNADRVGMPADSLQKRLDAGKPPSWLEPIGSPAGALKLYRVRPSATAQPAPASAK